MQIPERHQVLCFILCNTQMFGERMKRQMEKRHPREERTLDAQDRQPYLQIKHMNNQQNKNKQMFTFPMP